MMLHPTQALEPPADPARFTRPQAFAPELPLQFTNAILRLANGTLAGDVVIFGHGYGSPIQHQSTPPIQQVRSKAIPASDNRDAGAVLKGLLDNPRLLRSPAALTAAIDDDLNCHIPRDYKAAS
jgi:hypothetical protein